MKPVRTLPMPRRGLVRPDHRDAVHHSALGTVTSFGHGEVERSSGLYAILNALRLALEPHRPLTQHWAWIAYGHAVDRWQTQGCLLEALIRGIDFATAVETARRLSGLLSDEQIAITVEEPQRHKGHSHSKSCAWIKASLAQDCPVVIRLCRKDRRYSVVGGIDDQRLYLFDSGTLTSLKHQDRTLRKMFRIRVVSLHSSKAEQHDRSPRPTRRHIPASAKTSEGFTPKARAMRNRFSAVTLRSPRSILPMCERSISARCAKASCDTPLALRTARTAWPSAFNWRTSSSDRGLLDTGAPFQQVHPQATGYTTHILLDDPSPIKHVNNQK